MRRKILTALALTGALALGFGGAAAAAEDDTWGPGWGIGRMFGWGRGMMGAEEQLDRIDGRLAYMKTELKITDAQTAAWNDFASVVKTTAETHNAMMKEMMDGMRDGSFLEKPLPDRLVIQQTHIESRLEQIKEAKAAVDKLYALLTSEQKETADDIVLPTLGMGPGRGMGGHMRMFN